MRHDNFIADVHIRSRGRLPHWETDNGIFFVTFALNDAVPRHVALSMYAERDRLLATARTSVDRARVGAEFSRRIDGELDAAHGSRLLREHGGVVAGALQHFDGSRYVLHAWCVMPNHVHVVFELERGKELAAVLHSWKSFSAHRIGRGAIWQAEYFDRLIRDEREYVDTVAYVRGNPAKAGLRDWPWVG